ncbi:MAG: mechanosensitive ion channel family protein [Candidatus Bathyarchaeota archaeon]|nr:MAG: mechanosensitive ion channel family protein [Candidatus Bathyarchaeota archaeon]
MLAANLAELLRTYLGLNQLTSEIIASAIVFTLVAFFGWLTFFISKRYISRWAEGTKTKVDDEILRIVRAPTLLLIILIGAYYSLESLASILPYSTTLTAIFTVAGILIVAFMITRVVDALITWYARRAGRQRRLSEHLLFILKKTVQAIVYISAFLALLVVFRVDLSGIVVGLGVGGIAIALALQNVLSDVFSAFSIYFDRPFEVGDFIVLDGYSGTVRKIGIKSTRVQLLQGEELVVSNRQLTTASLRNFKKLKRRRIVFTLGVACDTPLKKLKQIPTIIAKIIGSMELVEFDRVHFTEFGDFKQNFEVVYYMKTPDYTKYMDTQQEINFKILEAFEKEGIKMPFPTQTILLDK